MTVFLTNLCLVIFLVSSTLGLTCWECHNARTNDECMITGRMTACNEDDAICEDQIRHEENGRNVLIEKRCKQTLACNTNVYQNEREAYPIQCNLKSPTSTCRCCCDRDMCNVDLLACWNDIPQFDSPLPERICKSRPRIPGHSNMQCYGNSQPGSYCTFECHAGYVMVGKSQTTCGMDFEWNSPSPRCKLITCSPREAPGNGTVVCTHGNRLRSHCTSSCNVDYSLQGSRHADCVDVGRKDGTGMWTRKAPYCRPMKCTPQARIKHGRVKCSRQNRVGSVCRFQCDKGYEVYPFDATTAQCTTSIAWDASPPCCTRPCPPNVVMDFVVVLDSSSSVGEDNWTKMKTFVRSFLDDFTVGETAAHYAIARYNKRVDTRTQILLNDYPNDIDRLLEAFDRIPYDGSGTYTGKALDHAVDVLLKVGNRPEARDVVLLITDGASQDSISFPARRLRSTGALVYVLPVQPPRGKIDLKEIEDIAGQGNSQNVLREALEGGFDALDENFAAAVSRLLCSGPCVDPFDTE